MALKVYLLQVVKSVHPKYPVNLAQSKYSKLPDLHWFYNIHDCSDRGGPGGPYGPGGPFGLGGPFGPGGKEHFFVVTLF